VKTIGYVRVASTNDRKPIKQGTGGTKSFFGEHNENCVFLTADITKPQILFWMKPLKFCLKLSKLF